ncbi:LacI family transcriptional regulator [Photobacterium sp. ZSDE20]|uniref:LacI family transcriptional regulator n=1 Tax=Photobacterium pectinilyticum TaxID=2906793 RepID=A0ABT1NCU7_9GAMM|nr:LacI family DNA-binding transcriptional regulator [Photobacterium sp. ZSDE20]MCQ1061164.1 LacI family transcriptional regulator [Photobacterium sp. ZSDE20]MDD1829377.1 LacI family transcriptional regulator [Photobacterium sp. ZSDE20]
MSKKVTLKELAKYSGTSIATVSRVLNNSEFVSNDTRESINRAIEQTGYKRQNRLAVLSQLRKIAIIANDDVETPSSFYNSILSGLKFEANRLSIDYELFLINQTDNFDKYHEYLSSFDGILLIGLENPLTLEHLKRHDLPVQIINGVDTNMLCSSISPDYEQGGYLAGQHFIKQSLIHPKIITVNLRHSIYQRQQGFMRAYHDIGADFSLDEQVIDLLDVAKNSDPKLFKMIKNNNAGANFSAHKLLPNLIERGYFDNCDSVFCICDMIAISLIQSLKNHGTRIPEDISVIGFDDLEISKMITPNLTTIHVNYIDLAKQGLAMLIHKINHGTLSSVRSNLSVELIERNSVK